MRRRHDPFLKRLYRAGTRDALTLFFPDLAAHIDWSHWHWIDKEIVIRGGRPRSVVTDLVGETRDVEGRYLKVLIHPELQMTPDAEMDWRAFEYNAGLMLREGSPATRVLTVVFYHCSGTGGIQQRQFQLDYYGISLHHVTYWSVGLGELDAEPYAERDNPMGWALASWMRQQREHRVELRLRLMEKILRSVRAEEYQSLLLDAVQTYYKLSRSERRIQEALLRSGQFGGLTEMAQTVLERLQARARRKALEEGLQEGRQVGLQEGRQEGAIEAKQAAVKQVIHTRFPGVPASLVDQVDRIQDIPALDELHRRAIVASSLEEIERLILP